jgi:hypothetical protein
VLAAGPAVAQNKSVKIGFVSTFSGPVTGIGNNMRDSLELALDHMGHKMGGLPVEVIYEDSGFKPAKASAALSLQLCLLRWLHARAAQDGGVHAAPLAVQAVEQQVNHRRRVERQHLRHQQSADDGDAERAA